MILKEYLKKKYKSKKGVVYLFLKICKWFYKNDISFLITAQKIYLKIMYPKKVFVKKVGYFFYVEETRSYYLSKQ